MLTAAIIRAKGSFKVHFTRHMIGNKFILKAFFLKIMVIVKRKTHILEKKRKKEFCSILEELKKKKKKKPRLSRIVKEVGTQSLNQQKDLMIPPRVKNSLILTGNHAAYISVQHASWNCRDRALATSYH